MVYPLRRLCLNRFAAGGKPRLERENPIGPLRAGGACVRLSGLEDWEVGVGYLLLGLGEEKKEEEG